MTAAESRSYEARQERPLTGLIVDLARDTTALVRKEFELAKLEMSEKIGQAANGAAMLAAGGLVAFAGLLFLLLAATYGLSTVMPNWAAALVVGGVVLLIGVVLLLSGRSKLKAQNLKPDRTLETLREDKQWARAQMSR